MKRCIKYYNKYYIQGRKYSATVKSKSKIEKTKAYNNGNPWWNPDMDSNCLEKVYWTIEMVYKKDLVLNSDRRAYHITWVENIKPHK